MNNELAERYHELGWVVVEEVFTCDEVEAIFRSDLYPG